MYLQSIHFIIYSRLFKLKYQYFHNKNFFQQLFHEATVVSLLETILYHKVNFTYWVPNSSVYYSDIAWILQAPVDMDMNFLFESSTRYFMRECNKWVTYWFEREKIKFCI